MVDVSRGLQGRSSGPPKILFFYSMTIFQTLHFTCFPVKGTSFVKAQVDGQFVPEWLSSEWGLIPRPCSVPKCPWARHCTPHCQLIRSLMYEWERWAARWTDCCLTARRPWVQDPQLGLESFCVTCPHVFMGFLQIRYSGFLPQNMHV